MKNTSIVVLCLFFLFFSHLAKGQNETQKRNLTQLSKTWSEKEKLQKQEAEKMASEKGWPIRFEDAEGRMVELIRLDNGAPVFKITDNAGGAALIKSDKVYPGGGAGLSLSGNGQTLGIWDAGSVLSTHDELIGRVTQKDVPASGHWHSTHVAGTMIASGVKPQAKGMSYAAQLNAYDWNDDQSEMAAEALAGMKVSQHSYGLVTGWSYSDYSGNNAWHWFGISTVSELEDVYWGYYSDEARDWDNLAHNAPNYLITKSAGNDRGEGPAPGTSHYYRNPNNGYNWEMSTTTRDIDGGATGYSSIAHSATAKNVLCVGAVDGSSTMSSFSGWGPTDDGRVKPDIVAKGVMVYSSTITNNSAYTYSNGTSMSGPMVSGSIGLLLEHQENLHPGQPLLSATVKALLLHTATDLGNVGPDYQFGWGLMNTEAAAAVMSANSTDAAHINELSLSNGETKTIRLKAKGNEPLKVTLSWNDVPGSLPPFVLNPTDQILVNDLDIRLTSMDGTTYFPYILNPATPSATATFGDNFRDNVEVIYLDSPLADQWYDLTIGHKGTLDGGSQDYSLVMTGNEVFEFSYLFDASDAAANYGGSWANADNEGKGFGAWLINSNTAGGSAGIFLGDPSSAGITGLANPSFGLYANPDHVGNYVNAYRPFAGPMSVGTTFSVDWGVNWDSNGSGNKGISLFSGGATGIEIININMGSSAAITINGNPMFSNYGTQVMRLHFKYISIGNLQVFATGRDGIETYNQTISVVSPPDAVRFYASGLASGDQRQPYFNNLSLETDLSLTSAGSDAKIIGDVVATTALSFDNLMIETGNSLILSPPATLTVSGAVDNTAGGSALLLQSNASGTASLLHNSNNLNFTFERYITGDANTTNRKYHTVSVPLTQSSNPLSGVFSGSYVYAFDAGAQDYVSIGTSTTTALQVDKGYLLYYPGADVTYSFAGKANNGSFQAAVSYPPFGNNFNLVPNPYPSAIDWDAPSGWTKMSLNNAIYVYNSSLSNSGAFVWASYIGGVGVNGGTRYVAQGQSFFVQANSFSPLLTMNNAVRLHHGQPFLKSTNENSPILRITAEKAGLTDEVVVRLQEQSTFNFDGAFDALKLFGSDNTPNIYTVSTDDKELSINSVPTTERALNIPLGIACDQESNINLSFEGMAFFEGYSGIYLLDNITEHLVDLNAQNTYSFDHSPDFDPLRFRLIFMGPTGTSENTDAKNPLKAWFTDGKLYVQSPEIESHVTVEILDMSGRLLQKMNVGNAGLIQVDGLKQTSVVLVRLTATSTVFTCKVFIP